MTNEELMEGLDEEPLLEELPKLSEKSETTEETTTELPEQKEEEQEDEDEDGEGLDAEDLQEMQDALNLPIKEKSTYQTPSTKHDLLVELQREIQNVLANQPPYETARLVNARLKHEEYKVLAVNDPIALKDAAIHDLMEINNQLQDFLISSRLDRASLQNMDRILTILTRYYR